MSEMQELLSGAPRPESINSSEATKVAQERARKNSSPLRNKARRKRRAKLVSTSRRTLPGAVQGLSVHPSLFAASKLTLRGLAQKRNKRVCWKNAVIKSSARTDKAILRHWIKFSNTSDYRFARFNKDISFLHYSDDEYNATLNADPSWSREQSDKLMALVKQYDRRFVVITDRFCRDFALKTCEDLKARYFFIQDTLTNLRSTADTASQSISFDQEFEVHRKEQLELLFKRTKEGEIETAKLVLENRRLEQNLRRFRKELADSKQVVKLQHNVVTLSNSLVEGAVKRTKRHSGSSTSSSSLLSVPKKIDDKGKRSLAGIPESIVVSNAVRQKSAGCFLRHSQLHSPLSINARLHKQLDQELTNMSITVSDLPVPTSVTCEMFDRLRQDMVTMFALQKIVLKREEDVKMLRVEVESASDKASNHAVHSSKRVIAPSSSEKNAIAPVVISLKKNKRPHRIPSSTSLEEQTIPKKVKVQQGPIS